MTTPAFEYPVLGIGRRIRFDVVQGEELREFRNERAMRTCDAWSLDHDALIGMQLIDGAGCSWRIQGVKPLRVSGNLLWRLITFLFHDQWYDVELDVAEAEPISFDELKARICKMIDDHPDDYNDVEAIVGEPDPPHSEQELLERRKAKVRKAKSIAEILDEIDASV